MKALLLTDDQFNVLWQSIKPTADSAEMVNAITAALDAGEQTIDLTDTPPKCGHCGDRGVPCRGCGGAE